MKLRGTNPLSLSAKCWLWVAAWAVAAGIMLLLSFPFYLMAPSIVLYFPTGLFRVFGLHLDKLHGFGVLAWIPYMLLTIWALSTSRRVVYMRLLFLVCLSLLLNVGGCAVMINEAMPRKQAEKKIEATKKRYQASDVRAAVSPLFSRFHYDPSKPDYGPPNYVELQPVPREIASLPLFADLGPEEFVCVGFLKEDTNAFIVFAQRGFDKWGVVVHRFETNREIPWMGGQTFIFWEKGVHFYLGSTFPD